MNKITVSLSALLTLSGCVSTLLTKTSQDDLSKAIAITENPDFPNPILSKCLKGYQSIMQAIAANDGKQGGIATLIAEKAAWDMVNGTPECVVVKARINAFAAKFGIVIPVTP